jgi:predicted acyl esterase
LQAHSRPVTRLIDVNAKGEERTPGMVTDYVVATRADHYRFVAGNSLRIRISGGDSMSLVPPTEHVDTMLQAGEASSLYMPPGC